LLFYLCEALEFFGNCTAQNDAIDAESREFSVEEMPASEELN
jgi:hypothetical protein